MPKHKKQHFIPRSYLKAWCDSDTTEGHEPYVWMISADGSEKKRKAPDNIFHETDMYTIHMPDGERDLMIEHGLSQLESEFVKICDIYIAERRPLPFEAHAMACAFVAAMRERTASQRDHMAGQWGRVLDMANKMKTWADQATPEQLSSLAGLPRDENSQTISYEQVEALASKPLQTSMMPAIVAITPELAQLDHIVLTAAPPAERFITSDDPCVWFDSAAYRRPPMYQAPGLAYDTIEITLPLSPDHLLLLNRRGANGYLVVPQDIVQDLNRRTRFGCSEYFIANTPTVNDVWLDPGVEPDDSWRKKRERERGASDDA